MMMMKFLLFSILAHFHLIMSSSVMPQYGDVERKQYDDFKLMSAFHKYLTIPTQKTYDSLRFCVRRYYEQSPIDCLNLLDRYRSNWVFKVVFWHILTGHCELIDPATITSVYLTRELLKWISERIRWAFFNCSCSEESKFKTQLEKISRMIKLAEETASELKSKGNNDRFISELVNLVATWKYLMRNISIDFENKTIDYYSLLRTFNEVSILIKTDSSSNGPSLRLFKRYALLWFYLRHICNTNCNMIFDIHHHQKIFIFYFVLEFWGSSFWFGVNELYPNQLRLLFEKLYENGLPQLEPILELFTEYNFEQSRHLLGVSKKISNYIELACSLNEGSKKYSPLKIWEFKALAELEAYLFRHGRKVDYSTKL